MRAWILFAMLLGLSLPAVAQERRAHVLLENGNEVVGRVVGMDLKGLELVVGNKIVTIPAGDIKQCRFEPMPAPAAGADPAAETAEPSGSQDPRPATDPAAQPPAAPAGEVAVPAGEGEGEGDDPATEADGSDGSESESDAAAAGDPAAKNPAKGAAARPTNEPATPKPAATTRFGRRIEAVERQYPWLRPTSPFQWISLGLLLFSGLSLMIQSSVLVAGAEHPAFGRSVGLAVVTMILAGVQIAAVPDTNAATGVMIAGNSIFALVLYRAVHRVSNSQAFVALAVLLGFGAVAFGVLQLVNSLLGSASLT